MIIAKRIKEKLNIISEMVMKKHVETKAQHPPHTQVLHVLMQQRYE
jgi:hypothetical protein